MKSVPRLAVGIVSLTALATSPAQVIISPTNTLDSGAPSTGVLGMTNASGYRMVDAGQNYRVWKRVGYDRNNAPVTNSYTQLGSGLDRWDDTNNS